ncbi:hypothetical protein [Streptomyces albicerus]|uniref:hypothetical protein n=1 Tax=Streptomyces albicerus TaxID=2569859 RepID=UPI00124B0124|nr:hypothetical protein [Streptomyces albicerus]
MTLTVDPSTDEAVEPSLSERLLASTSDPRQRVAVAALAEEGHILARKSVQEAIVWEPGDGTTRCTWEHVVGRLYGLGLEDDERAFLDLVLSIAGVGHQTSLVRFMDLDERRTAIVLRAIVQLSNCDTLAVGTRT